jgi:uncharacterized protein (TIRG00374 family)
VKRILQITAIAAITILFLWWFLRNANLRDVGAILRSATFGWVLIGFLVNAGALLLRTIRWRIILDPDDPPPFFATFFANTVGYMLSIILPIRAADFARPALLARRTSHRFSGALGTVLTERVLDLTSILSLFVFFSFLRWNEFSHDPEIAKWFYIVRAGAIASLILLAALAFLMVGLMFFRDSIRRLHETLGRLLPERFRISWMHFFDSFTETLKITQNRRVFLQVLLCTVAVLVCDDGRAPPAAVRFELLRHRRDYGRSGHSDAGRHRRFSQSVSARADPFLRLQRRHKRGRGRALPHHWNAPRALYRSGALRAGRAEVEGCEA